MGATIHPAVADAGTASDTPASAEAAPAAVDPTPGPAADAAPAATEPEPDPTPEAAEPVLEASDPTPGASDFGWSSWDGAVDALPEGSREWAQRVMEWKEAQHVDQAKEVDRLREYYSSWLDGQEDPRIGELTTSLEAANGKSLTAEQERDAIREEYAAYQKGVAEFYETQTTKKAESFKAEHGWIFDGGVKETAGSEMIDEGWPLSSLPVALKLKPEHLARARERFGSHPDLSLEAKEDRAALVMELIATTGPAKPAKNKSAEIVAGSDSTPSQSPRVDSITREGKSLRQQKLEAARSNINKARRGT